MKKMTLLLLVVILTMSLITGCSEKKNNEDNVFVPMNDLVVADDFNYQTTKNVMVDLRVLTNLDEPVSMIPFEIYSADPAQNGELLLKGSTDSEGRFEYIVTLPTYLKKVWVVGFMTTEELMITDNRIQKVYGGSSYNLKGDTQYYPPKGGPWSYLPGFTFNSQGVPSPKTRDTISATFLQRINATLPESQPLYETHPDYFTSNAQANVSLTEACDVWVTFVTEGAGYRNALGFFTFPTNNPPTSASQIPVHRIIMPNTSLSGSGGGMTSGDKVYIGQFGADISIGWFIVADGWISNGNVSTSKPVYYSIPSLNPEVSANKKKHSILVYDSIEQRLLVGFEDLPRENGSDEDFNDLIFYATANPIEAIDLDDVPPIDTPVDTDGDGVNDTFDDYPNDPELAYDNYTYSETQWGTLAFEDFWPKKGDYDFNDVVVKYNINQITNAQNRVKKFELRYKLTAVGASYVNGFAVEMPFNASLITNLSVSHPALFELENDGSKAVLRFFNSAFDMIPQQPGGFINTQLDRPYITPVDFTATFKLSTPLAPSTFNYQPPYNPFIFVHNRNHEIHLPGYTPTSRMNTALFQTDDDDTIIGQKYYKTENNLPWAVNIASDWVYPIERAMITKGYLKFQNWAQSNGNQYPDWYLNNTGYRDQQYLYIREQ